MSDKRTKRATSQENDEEQPAEKASKPSNENESMFSKPWKGSDAILIFEDKELHVHTQTLSLASPVFERMFNGSFKEAETKKVTLEGKSYELIENMLRVIYPFRTKLGKSNDTI